MKHLIRALLVSSALLLTAELALAADAAPLVVAKAEPAAKKKQKPKTKAKAKAKATAKKPKKVKEAATVAEDVPERTSGHGGASIFAFAAAFFASGAVAYAAKFTNPPPGKESGDHGHGDRPERSRKPSKQHSILDAA